MKAYFVLFSLIPPLFLKLKGTGPRWSCLHHMIILGSQYKITDFFMILVWASPFKRHLKYGVNAILLLRMPSYL